ncbi:MAG: tRNA (guanine-N1)-methyltransferase [Bacteroidales bacterium]|nr:MAG: tRNA (guanine-N1)-methyltransferase [Bacteroidales bacterium]
MKMYKTFFSITLFTLFSLTTFAQTTETSSEVKAEVKKQDATTQEVTTPKLVKPVKRKPVKAYLDEGTIKEQFDYMMKISNRYEDKKIIKINSLTRFQSNVKDSLNLVKKNLSDSKLLTGTQKAEITSLKNELESVKLKLEETVNSKDSMSLLGMQLPKSTYNTIMWILIFGSLVIAGLCFFLFKRSNVITVETKETLVDVREEFDTHRKNALVREQKLARKLQDEVIKNKNLGL